jgi:diguanylate cyclase (GGDEF)-like protein
MLHTLRKLFARDDDPYAGADLGLAQRLGSLFWLVSAMLSLTLWPLSPLDRQAGDPGWLIGAAVIAAACAFAVANRSERFRPGFVGILVASYVGAFGIAVMQWLAGGHGAPYDGLLINPLLLVAATNPLRRVAPFLAFVAMLLWAPLVYAGWDSATAAHAISLIVIWSALGFLVFLMMSTIRGQRLAMRRNEAAARQEARVDELTAIANRRAFDEALIDEISRADRMGTQLSLAMGDIEDFKQINDQFGHLEGDRALYAVAQAMDSELRVPDRVFRWGGDEFAVVLPGTGRDGARAVIERLQNKVAAACRRPDNMAIRIHFAAAELEPDMSPRDLCEAADLALMADRARVERASSQQL